MSNELLLKPLSQPIYTLDKGLTPLTQFTNYLTIEHLPKELQRLSPNIHNIKPILWVKHINQTPLNKQPLFQKNKTLEWHKITFNEPINPMKLANEINAENHLFFAQPNYIYKIELPKTNVSSTNQLSIQLSSNDPLYSQQWSLPEINLPEISPYFSTTNIPIIAIIDTGVDPSHEDLINQLWINHNEIPNNNIDDDQNGYIDDVYGWNFYSNTKNIMDDNSHGTHVAGIIGAKTNNQKGIASILPHVKLMCLKAANSEGKLTSLSVAEALNYAVNHHAIIYNLSFGAPKAMVSQETLLLEQLDIILQKNQHIVAAAGNQLSNINNSQYIPATIEGVLSVSSTTKTSNFASIYSNFGPSITLSAPGGTYQSGILSTVPSHNYKTFSGTSMAAPHVSATLGLLQQQFPNSTFNEQKIALINGTTDLGETGHDNYYGHGLLNITNAIHELDSQPPNIYHQTNNITHTQNQFIIPALVSDNHHIKHVPRVTLNYKLMSSDISSITWESTPCYTVYPSVTCTINIHNNHTGITYYFSLTDFSNNKTIFPSSAPTSWFTYHTTDLSPPVISLTHPTDSVIKSNSILKFQLEDQSTINATQVYIKLKTPEKIITLNQNEQSISITQELLTISLDPYNLSLSNPISITITLEDFYQNKTTQTFNFYIQSSINITKPDTHQSGFRLGPIPINNLCYIEFLSSIQVDVSIYIYSLSGQLIWNTTIPKEHIFTNNIINQVTWPVNNHYPPLPNGPYLAVLIAKNNQEQKVYKEKIIIFKSPN